MPERCNYLGPAQVHALRWAAEPINEAFGHTYLVGSALARSNYRDVDVRVILDDDHFGRLFGANLDQHYGRATALWTSICTTYSRDLSAQTGLPVDFQIQAMSIANRDRGPREALILPPALPVT